MDSGGISPPPSDTSALLFCDGAKPILWSKRDTRQTQEQVVEHNAVGVRECHWTK